MSIPESFSYNAFSSLSFIGKYIIKLPIVDSTNSYLKEGLAKLMPFPEGTLIWAEQQVAGRGYAGSAWHSNAQENLTFSILLKPVFLSSEHQFLLSKAVSVAIHQALQEKIFTSLKIKWPNDIYVEDAKLGGMLIENVICGYQWKHAIVGIGLNINQTEFPYNLKNATSLSNESKFIYDLESLLVDICLHIEKWYLELMSGGVQKITSTYLASLYQYNRTHLYRNKDGVFEGSIIDVTNSGKLCLKTNNGVEYYNFKEIKFIKNMQEDSWTS